MSSVYLHREMPPFTSILTSSPCSLSKVSDLPPQADLHLIPEFPLCRQGLAQQVCLPHPPLIFWLLSPAGVSEYLCTEISTSRQKKFSLVTFVDSPGLVDGDMKYPFDVNNALLWLGQ